mmetsp:Transcript_16671/g.39591  ORF Transcript_16671/g.39591 Transcript_16671/m.39591 type:complete len:234 (+) Transcript_16671:1237-1938(+)
MVPPGIKDEPIVLAGAALPALGPNKVPDRRVLRQERRVDRELVAELRRKDLLREARREEVGRSAHVGSSLKLPEIVRRVVPLGHARLEQGELRVVVVREKGDAAAPAPVEARLILLLRLGRDEALQLRSHSVDKHKGVVVRLHDVPRPGVQSNPKQRQRLGSQSEVRLSNGHESDVAMALLLLIELVLAITRHNKHGTDKYAGMADKPHPSLPHGLPLHNRLASTEYPNQEIR